MNSLKTFGRVTSSGLFKLAILIFALLLPIILIFGKPDTVKKTLQGSGIYSSAVDSALDSATKNASSDNSLPFNDPQVRAVVKAAVPPEQIQSWTEQIITSAYAWLNSNAPEPTLNIDFSKAKQNLADGLSNYAVARAKTLPVCTSAQLQALQAQGGNVDAFKLVCVPPGFDIESLRPTVQQQVLSNSDFLKKDSFTTADIPKDKDNGKTIIQQFAVARTAYKWAKITPYIWAGLALLFALLLFLLHDDRRRGAFVIGRTLTGVGIFITIAGIVTRYLTSQATSANGALVKQVHGDFQGTIIYIAKSLGNSLNNVYLTIGVCYLVIGVAILLILRVTRPKTGLATKAK